MTPRLSRAGSESGLWSAPAFPRPVRSFAGRRREIDRVLSHLTEDILYFVYGVGGIGKSELVYQLIDEIRACDGWTDAVPVLVDVRPGATATRTLTQLLEAVAAAPEPRRGQPTEEAHLTEQLTVLARALDAQPYLVFIDDVHHLPGEGVAEALEYLSRHVRRSRLFIASRRQIPMATDAPQPVVTTLGPLDAAAAEQMMDALAGRMQVSRPEPQQLMSATHGSPFHIRRLLARRAPDDDSLEASLRELTGPARRALLVAAVSQHRPSISAMRSAWSGEATFDQVCAHLEQRFLIDVEQDQLIVHDLVREALLGDVSEQELAAAHAECAALCIERLRTSETPSLIHAIDAIGHYLGAGRPEDAWQVVERWHSALGAAGSDHLLLEPLERLRAALPNLRITIDLLVARCHVRASLIEDADRVLSQIGDDRTDAQEARYCALSGEIAQRRGELARAEALFERAVTHAPDPVARFHARLHVATVVALLGGDGDRARGIVAAAEAEVAELTPRQRARCGWVRTVSWMFDERYEKAAEEARAARDALTDTGLNDLANRLAMVETLACFECDDMQRARAAARLIDGAGLRRRVATLYRAIVSYADGDARGASARLLASHDYLRRHGDVINAYIAGRYGSTALAAIGKLGEAQALLERTSQLAQQAGLRAAAAQLLAHRALLAAEGVQAVVAHRLAAEALSSDYITPRSQAMAHCAHSHANILEGDITSALEHIEHARNSVAGADLEAARATIDVEQAAAELIGGNLERAVELAEKAVAHYREGSREYETAKAQLVLAASYIARGRRTDVLFAERTIANARALAKRGENIPVLVGCAILSAALARRGRRDRAADELLAGALRELDPERGSLYASTLLAAIEGGAAAWVVPGAVALLGHLGFSGGVDRYLVDQHGRRAATDSDVARERAKRQLFVDEVRSVITARCGEVEILNRPMQCALLSTLVQARGGVVPAATLYERVWGVSEYHPLQHRNALYVAINRLRKCLRDALGDTEVIERANNGWRLADGADACVAIAVREDNR